MILFSNRFFAAFIGFSIAATVPLVGISAAGHAADIALRPDNAEIIKLGQATYQAQCAACHGANLEGAANWRQRNADGRLPAPPHDASGHTWHHPENMLFNITKYGPATTRQAPDYKSDMPAYSDILNDDEIIAVLSYIKSSWPIQIRMRHDMMDRKARKAR